MGQTPGDIRHDIEQTRTRMSATIDAIGYRLDVPARVRYRFSHIVHDVGGAFGGKPDGHNGGDSGLPATGEDQMSAMLQSAKNRLAGFAGTVAERVSDASQTAQTGVSDLKERVMETMTTASATVVPDAAIAADQKQQPAQQPMRQPMQQQMQHVKESATGVWRRVDRFAHDNALLLGLGALVVGIAAGMSIPRSRGKQMAIAPLAGQIKQRTLETGERVLHKGQQMAEQTIGAGRNGIRGLSGR